MTSYAFFHNEFVPLAEAKISIMTHALHYGTAVFEGVRGNWNPKHQQVYIFRLKEHMERLLRGCKVLKMELPYNADDLSRIAVEMVEKGGFQEDIYIRPMAYKSSEALGVRLHDLENDFLMFAIPWGRYIDVDKARVAVSSWHRPDDSVVPPQVKASGVYLNNAFAKTEAIENDFDEAIMLSSDGAVSEGTGENIFLVLDGKLVTPSSSSSILMGITRSTIIDLAKKELGVEVVERRVSRSELYMARECFLTGTAAHLTPIGELDRRKVGDGEVGEITRKLQQLYADVIRGSNPKYMHWCTPVYKKATVPEA